MAPLPDRRARLAEDLRLRKSMFRAAPPYGVGCIQRINGAIDSPFAPSEVRQELLRLAPQFVLLVFCQQIAAGPPPDQTQRNAGGRDAVEGGKLSIHRKGLLHASSGRKISSKPLQA